MNRRALLSGLAGAVTVGTSGCLDRFETRSAWVAQQRPQDPPEGVYVASSVEGMHTYHTEVVDDVAVGLFATVPHSFWLVTGDERERVDVRPGDSMHLMAGLWDPATGLVPPAEVTVELRPEGDQSTTPVSLWPMLAQRMGFHYGDNVQLPSPGTYEVTLRVVPTSATTTGTVAGRFSESIETTTTVSFEPAEIYDLEIVTLDRRRQGRRSALPLMIDQPDPSAASTTPVTATGDAAGNEGTAKHSERTTNESNSSTDVDRRNQHGDRGQPSVPPPPLRVPAVDELPGTPLQAGTSGDASVVVTWIEEAPADEESGPYLAVSPRTPYNRLGLPFMSLSVGPASAESTDADRTTLVERLDDRLGHHYGAPIDSQPGDELTLVVDSPPQIARHGGYETAFFDMEAISFTLPQ